MRTVFKVVVETGEVNRALLQKEVRLALHRGMETPAAVDVQIIPEECCEHGYAQGCRACDPDWRG